MISKSKDGPDKLAALRAELKKQNIDAYMVPRADEFQGEFVQPCAERLAWFTGFTGSAGMAIITREAAAVFTDSRYILQVQNQVDINLFETFDSADTKPGSWLAEVIGKGACLGYDPALFTGGQLEAISRDFPGKLQAVTHNLIDNIWHDRPAFQNRDVRVFPDDVAGRTSLQKRRALARELKEKGVFGFFINMPDSVCWLLNVRGADLPYMPMTLSHVFLKDDGEALWFIEAECVDGAVKSHIGEGVRIIAPSSMEDALQELGIQSEKAGRPVALDPAVCPEKFRLLLTQAGACVSEMIDPCMMLRAVKTHSEQEAIKKAHIEDGIALVRFLYWLDQRGKAENLTEWDIDNKLYEFRSASTSFVSPSFPAIVGYGPNGAIVHYRATRETAAPLKLPGLLLIDSGGQYHYGTTDITRTVALGTPDEEMKMSFTRVLKAHIALALHEFSPDDKGSDLDLVARAPLREAGLDFAHGTGHGVGCFSQVHERGAGISPRVDEPLLPGMLLSNEPGYYKTGEYGIRIENLVLVSRADQEGRLRFETVSLAPIDKSLIVPDVLSETERQWLNDYHRQVCDVLLPGLAHEDERNWLREQTSPL